MSLQNNDWRNFVHSDHLNGLKADEDFQLTAPEGEDSDEDSLGEQTTNVIEDPVDLYGVSIRVMALTRITSLIPTMEHIPKCRG